MTQTGEYKGSATITLNPDSKYPFTFGWAKAKAIVENIDDIRRFVAENTRDYGEQGGGNRDGGGYNRNQNRDGGNRGGYDNNRGYQNSGYGGRQNNYDDSPFGNY